MEFDIADQRGPLIAAERSAQYGRAGSCVVITGLSGGDDRFDSVVFHAPKAEPVLPAPAAVEERPIVPERRRDPLPDGPPKREAPKNPMVDADFDVGGGVALVARSPIAGAGWRESNRIEFQKGKPRHDGAARGGVPGPRCYFGGRSVGGRFRF